MLGQTPSTSEQLPLAIQVEAGGTTLAEHVTSHRSSRFLWAGSGLAVFMLLAMLVSNAPVPSLRSGTQPHVRMVAFNPSGLRGLPVRMQHIGRPPVVLPGVKQRAGPSAARMSARGSTMVDVPEAKHYFPAELSAELAADLKALEGKNPQVLYYMPNERDLDQSESPAPASGPANAAFTHELTSVQLQGVTVPVAIWRPRTSWLANQPGITAHSTYQYKIDMGKIASKLRVGFLSLLPGFKASTYELPMGSKPYTPLDGFPGAQAGDHLMFTHGFLGSIYDFAHAAEQLAGDGFTIVAPELPESLSASYETGFTKKGLGREEIIAATRLMADSAAGGPTRWGIWGHSAGCRNAVEERSEYVLGRACVAGAASFVNEANPSDPLFIVSSNGDGFNKIIPATIPVQDHGDGYKFLTESRAILGQEVQVPVLLPRWADDLRSVFDDGRTTMLESLGSAYAKPGKRPMRAAFIYNEDNSPAPLPNHISFLWREVDDAMIDLLSPVLPIAKALRLFMLDFDKYIESRDADKTATDLVPALRRFFLAGLTPAKEEVDVR